MATRPMKSISGLPGLEGNTYTFVQIDNQLATAGKAADAKAVGDELAEINETLPTKANVDGSYEGMTVGNAEQLVATVGVQDKVPYNFRTSGGSNDIGDREVDKIVGGSVAWNQYAQFGSGDIPSAAHGITYSSADGKSVTIDGTATAGEERSGWFGLSETYLSDKTGHVFVFIPRIISGTSTGYAITYSLFGASYREFDTPTITKVGDTTNTKRIYTRIESGTVADNFTVSFIATDLTQAFGSTIADYIYSINTATPGAGVAYFRKLFPKPYYAYNAGALMHVQTSGHKMVGFNQFDLSKFAELYPDHCSMQGEEIYSDSMVGNMLSVGVPVNIPTDMSNGGWFRVDIKAGTSTNPRLKLIYADGTSTAVTATSTTSYVTYQVAVPAKRVTNVVFDYSSQGSVYIKNACINLSWSGYRNGEYEPYEEHTYPLDGTKEWRGIPKLDANHNLYFDGDIYPSSGQATRRYGEYTFTGNEAWTKLNDNSYYTNPGAIGIKLPADANTLADWAWIPGLNVATRNQVAYAAAGNDAFAIDSAGQIFITANVYTNRATMLTGNTMIYGLATPTTESADPYANPQWCDDFGTEEYIDTRDVPIPVGHDTFYRANLRDKLQHLPEPAESNGMYAIQQTDEQMALVPMPAVLPALPTEDGTYSLKITVSGSTKTLTWEADA